MAAGKIQQEVAIKVTGLDDVKSAEKLVDKLDGSKAKVTVDADTKAAQKSVDEFISDLKGLDANNYTVALALKDADLQSHLTDILQEIAEIDGKSIDITAKMEQANQLSADIEKIETAIKEVNDTPIDIDTKPAKQGLDDIGKSADSSKSVLANMVGNATQDLGALGGVAGSAGVAIGQMGEYMADAVAGGEGLVSVLGSFGAVALPVVALGVGIALLTKALQDSAKVKFEHQQIDDYTKSLAALRKEAEGAAPVIGDFFDQIREQALADQKLEGVTNFSDDVKDLLPLMDKAGIKLDDYFAIVKGGQPALLAVSNSVVKNGTATKEQTQVLEAAMNAHKNYVDATAEEAHNNDLATGAATAAGKAYEDQAEAAKHAGDAQRDVGEESRFAAQALIAQRKEVGLSADALQDYSNTLSSTDWGHAAVAAGVTAMQGYSAQLNSLTNIAASAEEAQDSFTESIKKNGFTFDVATEKGRANQQALEDLGQTIDVKLGAAYASAEGNQQAFIESATKLGEDTLAKLAKQMHLNKGQTDELRTALGLTATDYEARFKLAGDEEARMKLGLLQSSIDALPKNVQAEITQKIITGDYQGAVATVQGYFASNPATLPAKTDPQNLGGTVADANSYFAQHPATLPVNTVGRMRLSEGGVAGPGGAIAGEAGPEVARDPHGQAALLVAPTVVPQGTVVTSTAQTANLLGAVTVVEKAQPTIVYVTINTGVIGNRYDLDRTVRRSVQNGVRLAGARTAA